MQLFIFRLVLALTGLGLLASTLALPGATIGARMPQDSPDPLHIRHGFVSTLAATSNDDRHEQQEASRPQLFTSTFSSQDEQTFLCHLDTMVPTIQSTLTSDCQQLLANLLDMPGFWSCSDWDTGRFYVLVGHGSCQFRVSRSDGSGTAVIGNGDVYSALYLALDIANQNGTVDYLGFYGSDICGPSPAAAAASIDFAI